MSIQTYREWTFDLATDTLKIEISGTMLDRGHHRAELILSLIGELHLVVMEFLTEMGHRDDLTMVN